ncbi:8915_t:CDS:2, partial [Racocetra fulgida]
QNLQISMTLFLVTSKFIKNIFQLCKQIKDIFVTEIQIIDNTIMCYNNEGDPVFFVFSEDITTILLEQARMSLYLDDLKRTDLPTRSLEEVHGKIWEDQVTYIRDKMRQNRLDQISLLQYYYLLGEWLEAQFWSSAAKKFIQINFSVSTYRYTWKAALRAYQLYNAWALVKEAQLIRAAE